MEDLLKRKSNFQDQKLEIIIMVLWPKVQMANTISCPR
jgi:hypothetical protein